jgi:hypothetical protein
VVDIGEEAIGEALLVGEGLVLLRRVERDADDDGVGCVELWGSITEPLAFDRSAGCGRRGVPPQHDPLSALVFQVDRAAILVGQGEAGGVVAF